MFKCQQELRQQPKLTKGGIVVHKQQHAHYSHGGKRDSWHLKKHLNYYLITAATLLIGATLPISHFH